MFRQQKMEHAFVFHENTGSVVRDTPQVSSPVFVRDVPPHTPHWSPFSCTKITKLFFKRCSFFGSLVETLDFDTGAVYSFIDQIAWISICIRSRGILDFGTDAVYSYIDEIAWYSSLYEIAWDHGVISKVQSVPVWRAHLRTSVLYQIAWDQGDISGYSVSV